jgi:eukaryotic-like serine/threonine-protein kinase
MDDSSILDYDLFRLANDVLDACPKPAGRQDFASYHILREIGKGGMGEVLLAEDLHTNRRVAIKFIHAAWRDDDLARRFHREITSLACLEHPSIARLYECAIHPDGTPYFTMEYVDGKPLDQYCDERECSIHQRILLFRSVCEAVSHAHSRAVIHLDLKPSNILVKNDGSPKLLDFGIARRVESVEDPAPPTQTRACFTPAFAAPEQILRQTIGTFTDVYSLGLILYQLLTGRLPYDTSDMSPAAVESLMKDERDPVKPSAISPAVSRGNADWDDLDLICLTALKKDPSRRYRSVVELSQDIDRYLRDEPLQARPDSLAYRARKFVVRKRTAVLVASLTTVLTAALVGFYTWRLTNARNAAIAEAKRTKTVEQFLEDLFQGGDQDAGPANDLKVVTLLDRGARQLGTLNRDPTLQADLYQTLGTIYRQLGNFNRADQFLQAALSRRRSGGDEDHALADTILALATLRIDQAELNDAEKLSSEALVLASRGIKSGVYTERARSTLAKVFEERGQYQKALEVLNGESGSNAARTNLTVDHAESLNVFGDAYFYLGRYDAARLYYSQAANVSKAILGPQHPRVAENLLDLGHIEIQLGNYGRAESLYRQALAINQVWYGNEHPLSARAENYLADALGRQGKFDEDRKLLNHALMIEEKNYGPDHPRLAATLSSLGVIDLSLNHFRDAETDFARMLTIYRSQYGEKHQFTALALNNLGSLYIREKEYRRAEASLREALAIYLQVLPAGALNTAIAQVKLGRALLDQRRYREAEPYSLAGYESIKKQASPSIEYLKPAASDLVTIYSALGQSDKAAQIRGGLQTGAAKGY